jgi:hypothetical protein
MTLLSLSHVYMTPLLLEKPFLLSPQCEDLGSVQNYYTGGDPGDAAIRFAQQVVLRSPPKRTDKSEELPWR